MTSEIPFDVDCFFKFPLLENTLTLPYLVNALKRRKYGYDFQFHFFQIVDHLVNLPLLARKPYYLYLSILTERTFSMLLLHPCLVCSARCTYTSCAAYINFFQKDFNSRTSVQKRFVNIQQVLPYATRFILQVILCIT